MFSSKCDNDLYGSPIVRARARNGLYKKMVYRVLGHKRKHIHKRNFDLHKSSGKKYNIYNSTFIY